MIDVIGYLNSKHIEKIESDQNVNLLTGIGKKCTKCGEKKNESEFYKRTDSGSLRSLCKACFYETYKEGNKARSKEWYKKNGKLAIERAKVHYANNKDKCRQQNKEWCERNPERVKELKKRTNSKRRSTTKGKLNSNISKLIWETIKKVKNNRSWPDLVGYNVEQLKHHIEQQFTSGMTWENYGQWHIDHIIPVAAFNFNSPEDLDFKRCWALKNLQPMWAVDNLSKGAKIERPFQPALLIGMVG